MKKSLFLFVFYLLVHYSFSQINLTNGLQLYYPLESYYDEGPNDYHASYSGASLYSNGKFCKSVLFDGTDDYVTAGNVLDFDYNEAFSVSLWVNSTSTSITTSQEMLIGKLEYGGNNRGWGVLRRFDYPNKVSFTLRNQVDVSEIRVSTVNDIFSAAAEWKHIILTYDGSASASGVKIYVNGTEESLTTEVNNLSATTQNTADFTLGSRDGAYSFFKGSIDEVRVYDRVLTSGEITLLARDGGLLAYYPFDVNADDESGNSYDGTISGAVIYSDPVKGNLASFDGSDDYIASGVPDFDYNDPFSVSFHVKSLSTSISTSQEVFVSKLEYGGNDRGWAVLRRFDYPNKLSFILRNQVSSSEIRLSTVNDVFTDPQEWKYIILTYDGSGNGGGVKVYVNGTEESLNLEVNNLSGTTVNTADFSIGSRDNAYSFFNGYIDEVRIYDRVMCWDEIVEYGIPFLTDNLISGSYLKSDLSVYPNPNTGNFLVDLTMPSDGCQVSLTNNLGQIFYSEEWKEVKGEKLIREIETHIETPGVYYLVLTTKEGTVSRKVVVR